MGDTAIGNIRAGVNVQIGGEGELVVAMSVAEACNSNLVFSVGGNLNVGDFFAKGVIYRPQRQDTFAILIDDVDDGIEAAGGADGDVKVVAAAGFECP